MTAATGGWATPAIRKQIRQCLLKLDVMARHDPHRGAIIRELAALTGVPAHLPGQQTIAHIHDRIGYLNRTTPRPSRIEVCHHEAGHAVVAHALGLRVRQVSVRTAKNASGSCLVLPANRQQGLSTPAGALRWCTALAAGPVASCIFLVRSRRTFNEESFMMTKSGDIAQMMRIIIATSRREDWIKAAYLTAERLVAAHWPTISRLALRLYDDRRDVSGSELSNYLRRPPRLHVPLRYGRAWPFDLLTHDDKAAPR
jgi:Peptidase M50B-like